MQKYLLLIAILSTQIAAMSRFGIPKENLDFYEIESADQQNQHETPIINTLFLDPTQPTIVKSYYYPGARFSEVEAILSNDDVVTYTIFHIYKSSICIHAKKAPGNFEYRDNASPYWVTQMEKLYNEKTRASDLNIKKNIHSNHFKIQRNINETTYPRLLAQYHHFYC